jgi:hypothetical protein
MARVWPWLSTRARNGRAAAALGGGGGVAPRAPHHCVPPNRRPPACLPCLDPPGTVRRSVAWHARPGPPARATAPTRATAASASPGLPWTLTASAWPTPISRAPAASPAPAAPAAQRAAPSASAVVARTGESREVFRPRGAQGRGGNVCALCPEGVTPERSRAAGAGGTGEGTDFIETPGPWPRAPPPAARGTVGALAAAAPARCCPCVIRARASLGP